MYKLFPSLLGAVGPVALLLALTSLPSSAASLFLTERFRNDTATNWNLAGDAELTGNGSIDPAGQGWLRLTSAGYNESAFAYNDIAIPSGYGIDIRFQYAIWGGSGADGFALVLFDGNLSPADAGAYGGSLGYAQRTGVAGLPGGILGIGFDVFGNYANSNEGRQGGVDYLPNTISIRGPGDSTANATSATGHANYEFIVKNSGNLEADLLQLSASLTRPTGAADYRDAQVIVDTSQIPNGHLPVTVIITKGANRDRTEVIANYDAYDQVLAYYGGDPTKIPATLKFGFTASTGASTNYHEIRGLEVISVEDAPGYATLPANYVYAADVPEPAPMFLYGCGLLLITTYARRRKSS